MVWGNATLTGPVNMLSSSVVSDMRSDDAVQTAIAHFKDWNSPWTFCDFVQRSLSIGDREHFEAIWREAIRAEHWDSAKLQDGTANAEGALTRRIPHLEVGVIKAIANAAAYQWA
jgi:hypothetical protein